MTKRVAVVTGAARGMGAAISKALLDDGLEVVGLDVNRETLEATSYELERQGLPFHGIECDVTNDAAVEGVFDAMGKEYGGIDALVNNAGTCFMSELVDISPQELHQQMAVNFDSAFFCCQKAIPKMLPRPGIKKIVNISSNGAYNFDVFDPPHYRASKAAMDTLTKDLARRYAGKGIAVNSIAPAMTRTDLFSVVSEDVLEDAIAAMPRGEPMRPEEIANWVAFLVSPAGDCASGNVIILNQGRDVR